MNQFILAAECPVAVAPEPEEWTDTQGAAATLQLSKSWLDKSRMDGSGPPYAKFGGAVRYNIPTLKKWAASRVRRSTSEAS